MLLLLCLSLFSTFDKQVASLSAVAHAHRSSSGQTTPLTCLFVQSTERPEVTERTRCACDVFVHAADDLMSHFSPSSLDVDFPLYTADHIVEARITSIVHPSRARTTRDFTFTILDGCEAYEGICAGRFEDPSRIGLARENRSCK